MMARINLLDTLPWAKRPLGERVRATEEDRRLHWALGKEYFDGTRAQGLGGYYYDGRWKSVVHRLRDYYNLNSSSSVLDIGCAKGFIIHDFLEEISGITVSGLDISNYAVGEAGELVKSHICIGNAKQLPYATDSFDLVISINSLHNILSREETKQALKEIERVSEKDKFVSLGAYHNEEEKRRLDHWAVVATTYLHVDDWLELFDEAGYSGDYIWFNP